MDPKEMTPETIKTASNVAKRMRIIAYIALFGGHIAFMMGMHDYRAMRKLKAEGVLTETLAQPDMAPMAFGIGIFAATIFLYFYLKKKSKRITKLIASAETEELQI